MSASLSKADAARERLDSIYDGFADDYDQGRAFFDNRAQLLMLAEKLSLCADVLEAGCGSGVPVLKFFAERGHRITGTDISSRMLELAAAQLPNARLIQTDSSSLEQLEPSSFDLITSFYSLFHLNMARQQRAFTCFHRLLRPGGWAYFTLASEAYTGYPEFDGTKVFAGVELPYAHITPEGYERMLQDIGFEVLSMEHLLIGDETMLWPLIRKK